MNLPTHQEAIDYLATFLRLEFQKEKVKEIRDAILALESGQYQAHMDFLRRYRDDLHQKAIMEGLTGDDKLHAVQTYQRFFRCLEAITHH